MTGASQECEGARTTSGMESAYGHGRFTRVFDFDTIAETTSGRHGGGIDVVIVL
jgi:hypothetical protein